MDKLAWRNRFPSYTGPDTPYEELFKNLDSQFDNKCYKVGLTLACGKCLYQKTNEHDNVYVEYVVPCGGNNHVKTGEDQIQARKHAETCPFWQANKDKPAIPHPEADKQFGKTSFCDVHRTWKVATWPGAPAHMAWKGPENVKKECIRVDTHHELWQLV